MLPDPAKQITFGGRIRGGRYQPMSAHTGVNDWSNCTRCRLYLTRKRVAITRTGGTGPIRILFIGEAPGELENTTGYPFIGISGKILHHTLGHCKLQFSYMITNTVGCRPVDLVFFDAETEEKFFGSYTDEDSEPLDGTLSLSDLNEEDHYDLMNWNREPTKAEIEKCRPHIDELVSTYKPHGIIYLGKVAESYKKYSPRLPQLDLYHPAFIARMEYKLLTVLREARKIDQFIERIENALERSV